MVKKNKYARAATIILCLCLLTGIICACIPFGVKYFSQKSENAITPTQYNITYDDSTSLGKFSSKDSYVYTDYTKIDNYRAGDPNVSTDLTIVNINTSAGHGTQTNPYVIASVDDWYKFAKLMESDGTHGKDKYFVLADDLQFTADKHFYPIRFFQGTFYGVGNTLKGISVSSWQYLDASGNVANIGTTTYGFGIFCQTTNATVTDLIVENYSFQNMPATPAYGSRSVSPTGVIVGLSLIDCHVLNCHTYGSISSTITYGNYTGMGGILGTHDKTTGTVTIYRCSTQVSFDIKANQCPMLGGIIGECHEGGTAKIYDCASIVHIVEASQYMHIGSIAGLMELSTWYVENVVGKVTVISTASQAGGALGSVWVTTSKFNFKNVYVSGEQAATESATNKQSLVATTGAAVLSTSNTTASNVNVVKNSNGYYPTHTNYGDRLNVAGLGRTEYSNLAQLITAAGDNVKSSDSSSMSTRIWDEAKTRNLNTYWADGYSGSETMLDYSPVRNRLVANVRYFNRTVDASGNETLTPLCYTKNNSGERQVLILGSALDTVQNTDWEANHKFLGWSTEKDSWDNIYTDTVGLFDDVDLYAVWEYTGTVTQKVDVKNAAVDSANSNLYTREYERNQRVSLESKITIDGMTDSEFDYQWYKKVSSTQSDKLSGAVNANYLLENVKDSGVYSVEYTFNCKSEPLWYGVKTLEAPEIKIKPAKLYLESLTTQGTAYVGMRYSDADVTPVVKMYALINGNKEYIDGTPEWTYPSGKIDESKVADGKVKKEVSFTPDAKYEGNYQGMVDEDNQSIFYEGEFAVSYLTLTFKTFSFARKDIILNVLKYGDDYTYEFIANKFDEAFAKLLNENPSLADSLSGESPAFVVNGSPQLVKDYRKTKDPSGNYSIAYSNVTVPIEIQVVTQPATFKVKYYVDSSNNWEDSKVYQYGMHIDEPVPPTKDGELFLGWYYNGTEPSSSTLTPDTRWDFDFGLIADDMYFTAKFLKADSISGFEVKIINDSILPLNSLTSNDIKVIAEYVGIDSDTGKEFKQKAEVPFKDLTITYLGVGNRLHVTSKSPISTTVDISYGFGTTSPITQTVTIPLKQREIDVTDILAQYNNGTVNVLHTGNNVKLDDLRPDRYPSYNNTPIANQVEYTYMDMLGNLIDQTSLTGPGSYTVVITFPDMSDDFKLSQDIEVTLNIRKLSQVNVKWSSDKLMFTGEAQHPTAQLMIDGIEVNDIEFEYLPVLGGKPLDEMIGRSFYQIKIQLKNADNYVIATGEDVYTFEITKATFSTPTVEDILVYDGTVKKLSEKLTGFYPKVMSISTNAEGKDAKTYKSVITLTDTSNCSWESPDAAYGSTVTVTWKIEKAQLIADWDEFEFIYQDGVMQSPKLNGVIGIVSGDETKFDYLADFIMTSDSGSVEQSEVGSYKVTVTANPSASWYNNYELSGNVDWYWVIVPRSGMTVVIIEWDESSFEFNGKLQRPSATVVDTDGNVVDGVNLTFGGDYNNSIYAGDYTVTVEIEGNYFIRQGATYKYKITPDANGEGADPNAPSGDIGSGDNGGGEGGGSFDASQIAKFLKEYWQAIVSGICLIFTVAFLAKTASYEGRRKRANKKADKYDSSVYAAATGLFGLASTYWNVIVGVCAGLTVFSLVIMIIAKNRCVKAEDGMEEAKEQYERNKESSRRDYDDNRREEEYRRRDEDMKAMFMRMMGGGFDNANMGQGMPQGAYMGMQQQGIGVDDIRGIVSDTVSALLPGMQQLLPQQASANDEMLQKLIEQNQTLMQQLAQKPAESSANDTLVSKLIEKEQKNDETIKQLMEQNAQNQKAMQEMVRQLAEKPAEKVVEKEAVAASANDELIKSMIEEQKAMREIVQKLVNQPNAQAVAPQPQIIERVVEKPVEKIVEKVVEKPVIHVISTDKSNVISTEAEGEAEKSQQYKKGLDLSDTSEVTKSDVISSAVEKSKQVKPAPKKETAPRLTLEEAYAKLTKEQKKYFDGLREYAMKKDSKCKEKLATYFTTIGPSTTNPLIKLTIKKGVTVALFKMEDEYLKDIRRNASSDGAKVKVKETEIAIPDAQSFDTAKDMIDLRIDQIERYADFLKEQRSLRK